MTARSDAEEIETTRSERFLAVIMTAFLLVGTIWLYVKIGDWFPDYTYGDSYQTSHYHQAHVWIAFALRLGLLIAWLAASYALFIRLRRLNSRYLPLGFAAIGAGVITALVMAGDYIGRYIGGWGPLLLSVAGVALTAAVFVWMQRWMSRRIPGRRARRGDCPFCGYPVGGRGPHCEGCGREVIADCGSCASPRRVGTTFCATCGAN